MAKMFRKTLSFYIAKFLLYNLRPLAVSHSFFKMGFEIDQLFQALFMNRSTRMSFQGLTKLNFQVLNTEIAFRRGNFKGISTEQEREDRQVFAQPANCCNATGFSETGAEGKSVCSRNFLHGFFLLSRNCRMFTVSGVETMVGLTNCSITGTIDWPSQYYIELLTHLGKNKFLCKINWKYKTLASFLHFTENVGETGKLTFRVWPES